MRKHLTTLLFLVSVLLVGSVHGQQVFQNEPLEEFIQLHQDTSSQSFDNSSLNGNYAYFSVVGVTPPTYSTELCSTMGVWAFDGKGFYIATGSFHCTIQPNSVLTLNGTYVVRSSGRVTFFPSISGRSPLLGILTDSGAGFVWYNPTTRGLIEGGYARRMR